MIHTDRMYEVTASNGHVTKMLGGFLKIALRDGADIVSWKEAES